MSADDDDDEIIADHVNECLSALDRWTEEVKIRNIVSERVIEVLSLSGQIYERIRYSDFNGLDHDDLDSIRMKDDDSIIGYYGQAGIDKFISDMTIPLFDKPVWELEFHVRV